MSIQNNAEQLKDKFDFDKLDEYAEGTLVTSPSGEKVVIKKNGEWVSYIREDIINPNQQDKEVSDIHYKWSKLFAAKRYDGKKVTLDAIEQQELLDDILRGKDKEVKEGELTDEEVEISTMWCEIIHEISEADKKGVEVGEFIPTFLLPNYTITRKGKELNND